MTSMKNLNDNIFLIRFKVLYEFYKATFLNDMTSSDVVEELVKTLEINRKFLFANLVYNKVYGYVNKEDLPTSFYITHRGIKFIEKITDGNMEYNDQDIINDSDHIVRLFQEGAEKYGQ